MSAAGMILGLILMLSALGAAACYIARRVYQCLSFVIVQLDPEVCTGAALFLAFLMLLCFARSLLPIPASVKHIFNLVSSYLMGFFIYLLLFFALADLILFLGLLFRILPNPFPQSIRFFSGLAAFFLTIGTVGYGLYNAGRIRYVSYDIQIEKNVSAAAWNLVLVSDLHIGAVGSEAHLEAVISRINALEPDLVCIAGDLFDNDYSAIQDPQAASDTLKTIQATYGVYACLGNHDAGKTFDEMLAFLQRSHIQVLNDEARIIDGRLVLIGRLDASPIGGFGGLSRKSFAQAAAGADFSLPVVVMDHNPAGMEAYGKEVDLVLFGHTHKGQIFPGNLFTERIFPVDYGYYRKDADSPHNIVTSGAGTWGMPMRVGTNCEIVQIRLHP
ncbi:MAG: metallophosphoesterase [Lachnospiraceae bacterium]|nr:metallophosphoesterase [Lachnospiraceae bacterium]